MSFRKALLFIALCIHSFIFSRAQNSFYLNHGSLKECKFTSDAIYFLSNSNILDKTDYSGNLMWSKSIGNSPSHITIAGDRIYYFSFLSLVKLDTSGNFIWGKDLSKPECGANTVLKGLVINGNYIYISTTAMMYGGPSGMLIFDTASTLLNQWCDFTGNDNYILGGFQRLTGGSWFNFLGQAGHIPNLVQIDSTGNVVTNYNAISLDGGIEDEVVDVIPMPDSSYISINRTSYGANIAFSDYHIDISNFQEDGTVIWKRSYYSLTERMYLASAGIDSSGNIYLMGQKNNDAASSYFFLKLDSSGNIIHSSEWMGLPYQVTNLYFRMTYRNGFLFFPYTQNNISSVLSIDTVMSSPCGITQATYGFDTNNTVLPSGPWYNYTTVTYSDTIGFINIVQQQPTIIGDLCLLLSSEQIRPENNIDIFPNPSKEFLKITSVAFNAQIEIYNALGKLCEQKSISKFPATLDVRDFKPGVYFLKLQTDDECAVKKIIIE